MLDDLKTLVERLKAVSHPIRLRVLALLHASELSVCQVAEILQVPPSSVSEALRELRRAGFVNERKEGRWVFVSVIPGFEADPLLKGVLTEALSLPEVEADRIRAGVIQGQSIAVVCTKVQAAEAKEVSRV